MPSKLPWFPFYPSDFATDNKVRAMTTTEVGCYFKLLIVAWDENPPGTIPDDDDTISRYLSMHLDEWLQYKPRVTAAFKLKDGRWNQKRLMAEAAKSQGITEVRSSAAHARWMQTDANAVQMHSKSNAQNSPLLSPPQSPPLNLPSHIHSSQEEIAASVKPTQPKHRIVCDEEFLKELKATGAYEGIDLDQELRRLNAWLLTPKGRGKKPTRQRFINWINKCDRPMETKPEWGSCKRPSRYLEPSPEVSDEQWEKASRLAREEAAKFKQSMNGSNGQ